MWHPDMYLNKIATNPRTQPTSSLGVASAVVAWLPPTHASHSGCVNMLASKCGTRLQVLQGLSLALLLSSVSAWSAAAPSHDAAPLHGNQTAAQAVVAPGAKRAHFAQQLASPEARGIADWVLDSGDNHGLPFVIVDKAQAKVFVFTSDGHLLGAASALLGLSRGDDAVPGIGNRKLSTIRPEERTTPAGRFVASLGHNLQGKEILWVDYETAISLHRVITSNAKERRAQRLLSPSLLDKRISYGCINVPVRFYEQVLSPAFAKTSGIVYVLPETRPAHEVFGSYVVAAPATGAINITK